MSDNNSLFDSSSVVFTPSGLRGEFPTGTSILQAAQLLGVDLESICGGNANCGRCQIIHSVGEFSKYAINSLPENLSPPSTLEKENIESVLSKGRRLGCSTQIMGDVVIEIPPDSQTHQQHIVKQAVDIDLELNPAVEVFKVTIPAANMHDPASDFKRLQYELEKDYQISNLQCDLAVIQQLQPALNKSERKLSVVVYQAQNESTIIAVCPQQEKTIFGLAVDLGSTTIAAHLCDLSSGKVISTATLMNPQIRFGEDLMSRVSYVMMNDGGDEEMTRAVREALNDLAKDAATKAEISIADIMEITVVCNPIMHHLLLGIDPTPLGSAPFALATEQAVEIHAKQLDLDLNPQARAFVLPCLAGHIGADTAGVILAQRPDLEDEITLLVDVGTNAEIVLGNKQKLVAASSPTGPAFEGAQISCGQRAAAGAIERVRINKESFEPRFKIIGCDLWSDDPEFIKQTEQLEITGICGSGIIELIAELFLSGIIGADGLIVGDMAQKTERVIQNGRSYSYVLHEGAKTLMLTQNDVRAIQLAKAALYAGIRLLMDKLSITELKKISLAGAFGSHIDEKYAMVLGLIPDCELSQVKSVGNAAGTGARIALLNRQSRINIKEILATVEKIETAIEPAFQQYFVDAMSFPHQVDSFNNLSQVVKLPEKKIKTNPKTTNTVRKQRRRKR